VKIAFPKKRVMQPIPAPVGVPLTPPVVQAEPMVVLLTGRG
jgi:hypothetical protein